MYTNHHANLTNIPFLLGRHGESMLNAGEKVQGKAQGRGDIPGNGLTDKGRQQAQSIYAALNAAGITVTHVSSSRLLRARETAVAFVDFHPNPKPLMSGDYIPDLEEVSQAGWEMEYTREELMKLRQDSLAKETEKLIAEGLSLDLKGHVAWIAALGRDGESPLAAALRGIKALEEHEAKPGELIISHAMLNRYMDAIATRTCSADRLFLNEIHNDISTPQKRITVLRTLRNLGFPPYDADHRRNKVANAGMTEYTINPATGLWLAGRRIEPPTPSENTTFIEYMRNADAIWTRVTPIDKSESTIACK